MKTQNILAVFVLSFFVAGLLALSSQAHPEDLQKHLKERLEKTKSVISDQTKLDGLKEHQLRTLQGFETKMKDRLNKLDKNRLQKLAKLPPGFAKKMVEAGNFDKLNNITLKQVAKSNLKAAFHMRQVAADKMQAAGKRLVEMHQRLEKAKDDFKAKKADFLKSKSLTDAKAYLTKVLDALIEQVNKLKERVQYSEDLNEEKVTKLLADLDARLTRLNEWKTKVESAKLNTDLTKFLVELRTSLRSETSILKALNVHGWRIALQHFAGILNQADHLDTKLNRLLTFAENNNVTVADKDAKVTEFESKLADAKKHFELAVEEFKKLRDYNQSGMNAPNVDIMSNEQAKRTYHDSIKTHMKEAKSKLKEARTALQSLVKEIVPQLKDVVTDDDEPVTITEQDVLDPTKVTDGVDIGEGETTVEIAEETALEL